MKIKSLCGVFCEVKNTKPYAIINDPSSSFDPLSGPISSV